MNGKPTLLSVLYLFEALSKEGLLQRDPEEASNILITRLDENGKETICSENAFALAAETLENEESLRELYKIAEEHGVNPEKHIQQARETLDEMDNLLERIGGK